jgi:hypothetical protein
VQDEIDRVLLDEGREVVEHRRHLVEALDALPSAADVPVAGVDDFHRRCPEEASLFEASEVTSL